MNEENTKLKKKKKWYFRWWMFIVYFFVFTTILSFMSGDFVDETIKTGTEVLGTEKIQETSKPQVQTPSAEEIIIKEEPVKDSIKLSDDMKILAITGINGYPEVKESAITQKEKQISLVAIVNFGTSKTKAKELGENFVRMVKTLSKDTPPEKEIGEGIYDYLITVAYPNETVVAMGAKVSFSPVVTW